MRNSVCSLILLALLVGCSGRKTLNESLAKTLLEERFQTEEGGGAFKGERMDYPQIQDHYGDVVTTNYSDPALANATGNPAIMAQLIHHGFLSQTSQTRNYVVPQHLTGSITGESAWYLLPGAGDTLDAHLSTSKNIVSGSWTLQRANIHCTGGSISGYLAMDDNSVWLTFSGGGYRDMGVSFPCYPGILRYRMQPTLAGSTVQINGSSQMPDYRMNLSGDSPQELAVTWYRYEWTGKEKALCPVQARNACDIGKLKVESVNGLVLQGTETQASATFKYRTVHSEFGKIVTGGQDESEGTGTVQFTKKPDGTWTVSGIHFQDHI